MSEKAADQQRNCDSGEIADETAGQGMPHLADAGNTEVKGEYVDDGFTAPCHNAGSTACIRVGTCSLHNVLHDNQRTAAGYSAEADQRQQFRRNSQERKYRVEKGIQKPQKTGYSQAVDR